MALNAFLVMEGQKSGKIDGSVTQKGHEGTIGVSAVEHSILILLDPVTGMPAGRRQHKPIVISKNVDKSSPLLYKMLVSNENIKSWELMFFRLSSPSGNEVGYYKVTLTNASIVSINLHFLNNYDLNTKSYLEPNEEVTFTYEQIQWLWVDGGITAEDRRTPVS